MNEIQSWCCPWIEFLIWFFFQKFVIDFDRWRTLPVKVFPYPSTPLYTCVRPYILSMVDRITNGSKLDLSNTCLVRSIRLPYFFGSATYSNAHRVSFLEFSTNFESLKEKKSDAHEKICRLVVKVKFILMTNDCNSNPTMYWCRPVKLPKSIELSFPRKWIPK